MLHALTSQSALHNFVPIFEKMYMKESFLFLKHGQRILSREGSRQGDPLGMLLFCLILQPILEEVAATFSAVEILAIADDVTILGKNADDMIGAWKLLKDRMAAVGLHFAVGKCHHRGPIDITQHLVDDGEKPTHSDHTIELLGGCVSKHVYEEELFLVTKLKKHEVFHRRLRKTPQNVGLPTLEKCLVPRMGYYLRTHAPLSSQLAANTFQGLIDEDLRVLLDLPVDPTSISKELTHLPRSPCGGSGIPNISTLPAIAYGASFEEFIAKKTQSGNSVLLQCDRNELLQKANFEQLKKDHPELSEPLKERGRAPSFWMDDAAMGPNSMRTCRRARLGLMPSLSTGTCPGCRYYNACGLTMVDHVQSCARLKNYNCSMRHSEVLGFLEELAAENGVTTTQAGLRDFQQVDEEGNKIGPDLAIYLHDGKRVIVDITFLMHFTTGVMAREKTKRKKYKEMIEANAGDSFLVACFSIFGAVSDETSAMLKHLTNYENVREIYGPEFAGKKMFEDRKRLSRTIARCNAQILHNASNQMASERRAASV
jgi:hypothetical protein